MNTGRLEAYYEQGMEGRIIYAFLADNDLPSGAQREALVFLPHLDVSQTEGRSVLAMDGLVLA